MTASAHKDELRATRAQLAKVIRRRPKVSPILAVLLSAAFACVAALVVAMDLLLASAGEPAFRPGEPAPMTVRVPLFSGFSDDRHEIGHGTVVVARGELLTRENVDLVHAVRAQLPAPGFALAGYFVILLTVTLLYTIHLRGSHRGQLLRTQAYTLLLLLGGALVVKMALLFTPMSVFLVPVAAVAVVAAVVVDRSVGLSTALLASMLMGLLVPFDLGVVPVLLLQSATAGLLAGDRKAKNTRLIIAGLAGGAAAAVGYTVLCYLTTARSPFSELVDPMRSSLVASLLGGVVGGLLAIPLKPLYQFMLGDITKSKLVELEDLSNPLLRQIAESSPGTWQHSLAMANMAEIAANAIGADGRLVRVGAYYHDLGKSLQPKYFIENLDSGESSPHDRLPPEISCDAIFAHVTEGIRVARQHRLPERIIDFMYMHHGDGLLEYFWAKCRDSGNPQGLTQADFRYPGVPPQNRETAILAVCDAVEAASRTLKKPDERAIESLVQRIVYGKLHLGQLDQSGLSMSDLRKISDSLRETIKHAHHGRIEYPWQREEKKAEPAPSAEPAPAPAEAAAPAAPAHRRATSVTQQIIHDPRHEPRLDSLDQPRPYYWATERARSPQRPTVETAPTEPVPAASGNGATNNASHSSLPVEIEAVVEDPEDQGSAPTMPLVMSESQSMAAPPMLADDVPEALEREDTLPVEAEPAAAQGNDGVVAERAPDDAAALALDLAEAIAVEGLAGSVDAPADAQAAAAGERDTPLPMGTAFTGPPPATRTGPVGRTRAKTMSGTKVGFPGAGQPAPELGASAAQAESRAGTDGATTRPGSHAEPSATTDPALRPGTDPAPRAATDVGAEPGADSATPDEPATTLRSSGLAK
jgi:putative nucleotidyltransferase with HDIG domain